MGDTIRVADGDTARIRWIGKRSVVSLFSGAHPVRVATGALGENLPIRDLCLSPDHALLLSGVLVQASALVNGTTITRMTDLPEHFTYHHVGIEGHRLLLAEGVPAETFVDNVTRRRFDNYAGYEALYGDLSTAIAEMNLPRVKSARQVPRALRERIAARAAELGFGKAPAA